MDQTMEDMRLMGFEAIFSQSFKTIFTLKKIFAQITFTLILPLTFVFIAHMEISNKFFNQIETSPYHFFIGAFDYNKSNNITQTTEDEWLNYILFKIITIAIVTIFYVLSTITVIHTIACIYTGRDITFSKCMQFVNKVWKRLIATLLFMFIILFAYTISTSLIILLCTVFLDIYKFFSSLIIWYIVVILYVFGFLYLSIVFHLACAVSILETSYGINVIFKAARLMIGKKKTALSISFMLYDCLGLVVYVVYMPFSMYNDLELELVWRVMIGIMCGVLVVIIFLVIMVTQTVLYLVCKSHHHETIEVIQLEIPQNQPLSQV